MPKKIWYTLEKLPLTVGQEVVCWYKIADQDETRLGLEVSEVFVRNGTQYAWGTCTMGDRQGQSLTLDTARILEMELVIRDVPDFQPVPIPDGKVRYVVAGHFRVFGFVEDVSEMVARTAKRRGGSPIEALRVPVILLLSETVHEKEVPAG